MEGIIFLLLMQVRQWTVVWTIGPEWPYLGNICDDGDNITREINRDVKIPDRARTHLSTM